MCILSTNVNKKLINTKKWLVCVTNKTLL